MEAQQYKFPRKATVKVELALLKANEQLNSASISFNKISHTNTIGGGTIKIRFSSTEEQLKAKTFLETQLNNEEKLRNCIKPCLGRSKLVGCNQCTSHVSRFRPERGVHFMLEIDQGAVISTKLENVATDTRSILRK